MRIVLLCLIFMLGLFAQDLTSLQLQMLKNAGFDSSIIPKNEKKEVKKEQLIENNIKEKTEVKLKRFASNFFTNSNTLNPYSTPIPKNYKISKADILSLDIYGAQNENFSLKVNRKGNVTIPQVGEIKVLGLTFNESKNLIIKRVKEAYPSSTSVLFDIEEFTPIQITLSGLVKNPGLYNLPTFSTIKDALILAKGILPSGSYRYIELKRVGEKIKKFDLYSLIKFGKNNDLPLESGDIIYVKTINKEIKLKGEVNIPAIYELKNNETFKNLFSFASNLKANANLKSLILKRYENSKIKVLNLSLKDLYKLKPKNGDELTVLNIPERSSSFVTISGNVQNNIELNLPKNKKLSSLFENYFKENGKNSLFKLNTNFSYAKIENIYYSKIFNLKNILEKKDDVLLNDGDNIIILSQLKDENMPFFYAFGEVVIEKNNKYNFLEGLEVKDLFSLVTFKSQNKFKNNFDIKDLNALLVDKTKIQIKRVEKNTLKTYFIDINKNPNFKVKAFDEISFFSLTKINTLNMANIKGAIFIPNNYYIDKDMTLNKLITLSGGLTKKALKTKFELVRYKTINDERIKEVKSLSLKNALLNKMKILPDDEITIFSISNWLEKEYITLKGEVKYPGTYAISKGEKLLSVIKRAGGFTKEAFLEGSIFTRDEVQKLQEKRLQESMDRIKKRSLQLSSQATEAGESKENKENMLLAISELEQKVESTKPIGRISINLYYDLKRFKKSDFNISLKNKDVLYIPTINDTVSVVGEVLNQNTFVFRKNLEVEEYINKAGGITQLADEQLIYVVKANGEAIKFEKSFFFSDSTEIFKGDTIVVPLKVDTISDIKYAKDVTSILYQLAVTAASLKTVGAF